MLVANATSASLNSVGAVSLDLVDEGFESPMPECEAASASAEREDSDDSGGRVGEGLPAHAVSFLRLWLGMRDTLVAQRLGLVVLDDVEHEYDGSREARQPGEAGSSRLVDGA